MKNICLNIEPFVQAHPARNPGGDCFACAFLAGIRHLLPEGSWDFDSAFDAFKVETVGGSIAMNNSWIGMQQVLRGVEPQLEVSTDIAAPKIDLDVWSHAWFRGGYAEEYAEKLFDYLSEGAIVWTEIMFSGAGPIGPKGGWNHIDHFVIVDGIRELWKECKNETINYKEHCHEIHVVCSDRGGYWIDLREFLHKHGAAGWIIARRREMENHNEQ